MGRVTRVVLLVVVIGLALWATVAALVGGPQDTVSAHIRDYCERFPLLPLSLGVLLGHWFWPLSSERRTTF